eukprot:200296_1
MSADKDAPARIVWLASSFAGLVEGITVQPFDMIKTRNQLLETNIAPNILKSFSEIYHEGGVLRFYRGLLPELAGMIPKTTVMYSSYEFARRYFATHFNNDQTNWKVCAMAGFISGYAEAITVCPFQVIKVRLQSKMYLGKYRNTLDCYCTVFREEGIRSLFIGLGATFWRNCVWNTIYFGLMYQIKENVLPDVSEKHKLYALGQTLAAGFVGGVTATMFNAPFDVVKSRVQQQNIHDKQRYRYTLSTLYMIYHHGGISGCYRGLQAKVIRMGVGGAVCMATFEGLCQGYVYYKESNLDEHVYAI